MKMLDASRSVLPVAVKSQEQEGSMLTLHGVCGI